MTTSAKTLIACIGSVTGLRAVAAGHGTLAEALASAIGIGIRIDEGLPIRLISGLLTLVMGGMGYCYWVQRHPGPLLASVVSAAFLLRVFAGSCSKPLELTGFTSLAAASGLDFRGKKRVCADPCGG